MTNLDATLVLLYSRLFTSAELSDPLGVSAEILSWLKEFNRSSIKPDSLLLWLSIVRRIFSDHAAALLCSSQGQNPKKCGQLKNRGLFADSLLKADSFFKLIARCLQSEDQLASYLAGKVLSEALQLPQCNTELCLTELGPLMSMNMHEPMYGLQVMKSFVKQNLKQQLESRNVTPWYLPEFVTLWWDCNRVLTSRLATGSSSKWPELNFAVFLEICTKLLSCSGRFEESGQVVIFHLQCYSELVRQHCRDIFTLRKFIKLCFKMVKMVSARAEVAPESRVEVSNAMSSLLETTLLQETVRVVVAKWDSSASQGEEKINIEKSVARRFLILLMNYASIQSEYGEVEMLEKQTGLFLSKCNLHLPREEESSISRVQGCVLDLVSDQDTALVETLQASLALWRKKSLWLPHLTLRWCFQCTQLHHVLLRFLRSVSFDHTLLLDFLISSETQGCVDFLENYATGCCEDWWGSLCAACGEEDRWPGVSREEAHDYCDSGMMSANPLPSTPAAPLLGRDCPYQDTTLDQLLNCFTQLRYSLTRLDARKLLPFHAELLVAKLEQMEDLYEEMNTK